MGLSCFKKGKKKVHFRYLKIGRYIVVSN